MNIMVALPGEQYFAIPRSELDKYAVPKDAFDKQVENNLAIADAAGSAEVEGQEERRPFVIRTQSAVMGVRG